MTSFEMIKYHGQEYPPDIPLNAEEIAAHFDITHIGGKLKHSLHTEYSYGKRKMNSELLSRYPEISEAHKDGIPQLWKNNAWALQFADFIFSLVGDSADPCVIEIHPPFSDYTDISGFIKSYSLFEAKIKERFSDTEILIENRCGSIYHGGKFLVSKVQDIAALCNAIEKSQLQLRIAYDVPQIFTAHNAKKEELFIKLLEDTKPLCQYIGGVHLWGKKLSRTGRIVAHCGDLNTYFGDSEIKAHFLRTFKDCFDDGITRKMVLEVNSGNEDLLSIISDLRLVGISFS
ncbi:MAG: hypothetical protein IK116_05410 [Firmicutes bacterium]|nr:hypothetical protein [Bacillota bacterium]